jgi:hypothetical protein
LEEADPRLEFEEPMAGVDFDDRRALHRFGVRADDHRLANSALLLTAKKDKLAFTSLRWPGTPIAARPRRT